MSRLSDGTTAAGQPTHPSTHPRPHNPLTLTPPIISQHPPPPKTHTTYTSVCTSSWSPLHFIPCPAIAQPYPRTHPPSKTSSAPVCICFQHSPIPSIPSLPMFSPPLEPPMHTTSPSLHPPPPSHLHKFASEFLQLPFAELSWVDRHAALGPAKGDVHHCSLPGHQGRKTGGKWCGGGVGSRMGNSTG